MLLVDGRPPLSLHPLLTYRPDAGDDGAFFFYNDLRKNHASTLNYLHALWHRDGVLFRRWAKPRPTGFVGGSGLSCGKLKVLQSTAQAYGDSAIWALSIGSGGYDSV